MASHLLNIPLSRVMSVGDGDSEADMLQAVEDVVAMGNAMPLPLSVARSRALTSDEGGVGASLEQVYSVEWHRYSKECSKIALRMM